MNDVAMEVESKVTKHSRESLFLAYRWCAYAWICVATGFALRHFSGSGSIAEPIGGALVMGGLLFSFVAMGLSIVGFVLPGAVMRGAFWGPLVAALPPLVFPILELIGKVVAR